MGYFWTIKTYQLNGKNISMFRFFCLYRNIPFKRPPIEGIKKHIEKDNIIVTQMLQGGNGNTQ